MARQGTDPILALEALEALTIQAALEALEALALQVVLEAPAVLAVLANLEVLEAPKGQANPKFLVPSQGIKKRL